MNRASGSTRRWCERHAARLHDARCAARRLATCLLLSSALVSSLHAQGTRRVAPRVLVIDSVHLVDAASNRTGPLQRVIVRGDRIHAVTSLDAPLPDTVDERISAEGAGSRSARMQPASRFWPARTS